MCIDQVLSEEEQKKICNAILKIWNSQRNKFQKTTLLFRTAKQWSTSVMRNMCTEDIILAHGQYNHVANRTDVVQNYMYNHTQVDADVIDD